MCLVALLETYKDAVLTQAQAESQYENGTMTFDDYHEWCMNAEDIKNKILNHGCTKNK